MTPEQRAAHAAYTRKWRADHPGYQAAYAAAHLQEHAARERKRRAILRLDPKWRAHKRKLDRASLAKNPRRPETPEERAAHAASTRQWRADHPGYAETYRHFNPPDRAYVRAQTALWRVAHPGYSAAYLAAHLPEHAARQHMRRGRLYGAAGGHTGTQTTARWAIFGDRCWMCGRPATSTDHVKPISKGGADWAANLRPACKPCNNSKWARWSVDWLTRPTILAVAIPRLP